MVLSGYGGDDISDPSVSDRGDILLLCAMYQLCSSICIFRIGVAAERFSCVGDEMWGNKR